MTMSRSPRRLAERTLPLAVAALLLAGCAAAGGGFGGSAGPAASADPETLIGLAPQQLGEALGVPELQRREPPAEVWQYRTATCVFDIYLYDEDDGPRAAHYEARSRSNGAVDPALCLGSVVQRYRVASAEETPPAQL